MKFIQATFRTKAIPLAILLTALFLAAMPYDVRIMVQKMQSQATAANHIEIAGQYLVVDGEQLDLKLKPALFIDASCQDLLAAVIQVPLEKRPYLVVAADQEPDFIPAKVPYYWSAQTGAVSPSLIWYDQQPIGYMFAEVGPLVQEMLEPVLIGQGKITNNTGNGSGHNAVMAAKQISGAILQPGETFSFYDYVLPAKEYGYVEGLTLYGSQWLPDIGGGICRTSTALNFAVENAKLEVVERHHHSKPVTYAPPTRDTAVTRSGGKDYRFRNTTDQAIKIIGRQNGEHLEFEIYQIFDVQVAKGDSPNS